MKQISALQSDVIKILRFPLIVGVVMIHAYYNDTSIDSKDCLNADYHPIFCNVSFFCSQILCRISVPLFFLFSGYLFFCCDNLIWKGYIIKIKNRVRSVLIPYILWNFFAICFFAILQFIHPGLLPSMSSHPFIDYSVCDWLFSFWDISLIYENLDIAGHYPMCYQFWFIRDLMVMFLFAPLIYYYLRIFGFVGILLLGGFWFWKGGSVYAGIDVVSFFFFSIGAYVRLSNRDFIQLFLPYKNISVLIYLFLSLFYLHYPHRYAICQLSILVGIVMVLSWTSYLLKRYELTPSSYLANATFFVFAFHNIPLIVLRKMMFVLLNPMNDVGLIFVYLFCPAVIICLSIFTYGILNKYYPRFAQLITGYRKY